MFIPASSCLLVRNKPKSRDRFWPIAGTDFIQWTKVAYKYSIKHSNYKYENKTTITATSFYLEGIIVVCCLVIITSTDSVMHWWTHSPSLTIKATLFYYLSMQSSQELIYEHHWHLSIKQYTLLPPWASKIKDDQD